MGLRLALIGSINDEILNIDELAMELITSLRKQYPGTLEKRFQMEESEEKSAAQILEEIARVRGCLIRGGELDYGKASKLLMDDFRSGKLGRVTLEFPDAE